MIIEAQAELETSRRKLLDSIAGASDITFVRAYGNIGDQLIYAGTRRLLSGIEYKEVSILNLAGIKGELALIAGGGAWCGPYHDMPGHLPLVEERFRRVIVLPSSFDASVASVRHALAQTKALVFAREAVSYEQIRGLCQAELAHDCAFFFDYAPYKLPGQGLLNAYRSDLEAARHRLPADNNDISITCESVDEWLWTIARHEVVYTDRAHVMIAAALLGKRVFYQSSSYHKLPAIADFALRSYPVVREEEHSTEQLREKLRLKAEENLARLPSDFFADRREIEITIVMLSYHRLDQTINAIKALADNVAIPFKLLLIDNDSGPDVRRALKEISATYDFIELILLDENLGCVGGRAYAMELVQTPYVMLIDNDIEVFPGSVEHLLHCLETNQQALAATGKVIFPDGSVHLCGGEYRVAEGLLNFELCGFRRRYDEPIGESGPCQWVPGCLTLLRREALLDYPYDLGMRNYYEDLEWSYRLNQLGLGNFYRVVESVALHFHQTKTPNAALPAEQRRKAALKYIETIAHFYQLHQLVIPNLFDYVPELGSPLDPLSRLSAGLFLTLVNCNQAGGVEGLLEKWNQGELAPLFAAKLINDEKEKLQSHYNAKIAALEQETAALRQKLEEIYQSKHWKLLDRYWRLRRAVLKTSLGDQASEFQAWPKK
jgi:GT2 family glycosyltransferase/exopolysaccharide biosynthesis predicted pyruvyltransferase EpsI